MPGQSYALQRLGDWRALRAAIRRAPPTAICITEGPALQPNGDPGNSLRQLLLEFPSATVLTALHVHPSHANLLTTLYSWGVADTIDLIREHTPDALARRLGLVQGRCVRRLLNRAVPKGIPTRTRWLLTVAAEVVAAGGGAQDLAESLGVDERTVPRWCRKADLPPPRTLLAWLRMLVAADLLDDPGRSFESVARSCGYATSASMRGALRNLFRLTPRELRERGAFTYVSRAFSEHLFQLREAARDAGKPATTWLN